MTRLLSALAALAFGILATTAALAQPVPGRYIVVYKDSVADPAGESERMVREAGGRRLHAYRRALKGFAATLSDEAVQKLRNHPDVAYVEQDQVVTASDVENSATWGLDRIDQADRPIDTQYHYNYTGNGVYAFVIDTGIRATHSEFSGRVLAGYSVIAGDAGTDDSTCPIPAGDTTHGTSHGTHVAGTIGGATWGVAKQAWLVPVRVLDCSGSGTTSGVIAGVDWVAASSLRPAVANMSLGGGLSSALNAAVARAVAAGVTMVVAAGNENTDACRKSPASEPSAITVGATTSTDARASFSNFGHCVDLFAPGQGITSSVNTSDTASQTWSGTSMATPHVTGVAALALQANPSASPAAVTNFIVANATTNRLTSIGTGSPNLLLYSLAAGAPTEPPLPTIAVKTLTGVKVRVPNAWAARATITIRDVSTGSVVAGAVVSGSFAPGNSGQCTTGSTGSCQITSSALPKTTPSTVFTVTDVAKAGAVYDSSQNAATQVTINQAR